jgi:hypothetical protein
MSKTARLDTTMAVDTTRQEVISRDAGSTSNVVPMAAGAITPMDMLAQALERGMAPDVIGKFMDLADRWQAAEAQRGFNEAFAAFKSEAVKVARNRDVTDGPLKGRRYAELFSFVDAATPALSKHGLSASWNVTRDEKDWIEVTCVIEHVLGGTKRASLGGPPDTGGAKNPLQARISTVTYLERATFKAVTGLAEQGDDDDGNAAGSGEAITDEQAEELLALAAKVGADIPKFCRFFKVDAIASIPAKRFADAKAALRAKEGNR